VNIYLFIIFQSLQLHPTESAPHTDSYMLLLDSILSVPCPSNLVDLKNCQQGAFNCYGLLIRNEVTGLFAVESSERKIVKHVFSILGDHANHGTSQRICMVNALVTCAKGLNAHEIGLFADCCLGRCISLIRDVNQEVVVQSSLIHVLLVMTAQLKSAIHPFSFDIINILQFCLASAEVEIRKGGVKLFSALLVARDDLIVEYEQEFQEIFQKIKSIGMIDEDSETRLLAEKFVQLLKL